MQIKANRVGNSVLMYWNRFGYWIMRWLVSPILTDWSKRSLWEKLHEMQNLSSYLGCSYRKRLLCAANAGCAQQALAARGTPHFPEQTTYTNANRNCRLMPQTANTGCTPQSPVMHRNYWLYTSQTAIAGGKPQNANRPAPLKPDWLYECRLVTVPSYKFSELRETKMRWDVDQKGSHSQCLIGTKFPSYFELIWEFTLAYKPNYIQLLYKNSRIIEKGIISSI